MKNYLFKNYYILESNKSKKLSYGKITSCVCFDLDWTLIKTKSGRVFPKSVDDWDFYHPLVPIKLKKIKNKIIIIFSNQMGVSKNKVSKDDIYKKIDLIQKRLNIPFVFIAATHDDKLRKPRIGMWRKVEKRLKVRLNLINSLYVGDMAGREKDRSSSDREFAFNLKIPFFTPEQYFLGKPEEKWNYKSYDISQNNLEEVKSYPEIKTDIILLMGYPGSGKTTLAKEFFTNYLHLSGDEHKVHLLKKLRKIYFNLL